MSCGTGTDPAGSEFEGFRLEVGDGRGEVVDPETEVVEGGGVYFGGLCGVLTEGGRGGVNDGMWQI